MLRNKFLCVSLISILLIVFEGVAIGDNSVVSWSLDSTQPMLSGGFIGINGPLSAPFMASPWVAPTDGILSKCILRSNVAPAADRLIAMATEYIERNARIIIPATKTEGNMLVPGPTSLFVPAKNGITWKALNPWTPQGVTISCVWTEI